MAGLSGGAQVPIAVTIQNLTISDTLARGGDGGIGSGGGGGGAGLGGAILIAPQADVTLSNVSLVSNSAVGGNGGVGVGGAPAGGGGGGLGGNGGAGDIVSSGFGGGGGGFGLGASGGSGSFGGAGILVGGGDGGASGVLPGGVQGGGGTSSGQGAGGGGNAGGPGGSGAAGGGGFGGGGGGAISGLDGGVGGTGGGGGGGAFGFGGYGGGAGGDDRNAIGVSGGFAGGAGGGSALAGGGGGGALGGAIFVDSGGTLTIAGAFSVNGSAVTAGRGAPGGTDGNAYGAAVFFGGSGSIVFAPAAGQSQTVAGVIGDEYGSSAIIDTPSMMLIKTGGGTLTLGGANQYAGGTIVDDGTLRVASAASLGSGELVLDNSGTIAFLGSSVFTPFVSLGGTPNVSVAAGQAVSFTGQVLDDFFVLDAPGSLNVTGGGTLTLANTANSYSGGTSVAGNSTLVVAGDGSLGDPAGNVSLGDAVSGGTIGFTSGSTLTTTRNFALGAGGGTIDTAGTAAITLGGAVTGAGALTKSGTGALTLAGTTSYSGGTNVAGGTLIAGSAGVLGTGPVTVAAPATLNLNSFNQTVGSLGGGGVVLLGSATLNAGGDNTSTLFSGTMSGTGAFVKSGSGVLTLTGANSYSGGTTVTGGTLLGTTSSLQGNIVDNGVVAFDQATSGTFAGALSGSGSLVKSGAGILTLSGANTYGGGTAITGGGGISIGSDAALGAAGGAVSLGDAVSSGSLLFTNAGGLSSNRLFTLGAGGAVFDTAGGAVRLAGGITGAGGLTKTGAGLLELAAPSSYLGPTVVAAGALRAGAVNVFGTAQSLVLGAATSVDLNGFDQSVGSLAGSGDVLTGGATLTTGADNSTSLFAGQLTGSGSLVKVGGGALVLTGANTYSGGTSVLGGSLVGNTTSLQGDILNDAVVQFDQNADGTYAGSMTGSGILAKSGSGVLTLDGANTYSGGTVINGGSIVGSARSLRGFIVNNGALTFGGNADGVFSGQLSGTGTLTKTGAGTLFMSGLQPDTGLFTVSQGSLALDGIYGGNVDIGSGAAAFLSGGIGGSLNLSGTLHVTAPGTATFGRTFSGSGEGLAAVSGGAIEGAPYLTIAGDFNAGRGSVLDFAIGPGATPTILVGGTAALDGTRFNVTAPSIGTARSTSFLALAALNGLSVTNSDVVTGDSAVVPVLNQSRNDLFVTLLNLHVPLGSVAKAPNLSGVAAAIDRSKFSVDGDAAFVVRELTALDDAGLNGALEQVGGQLHATVLQTAVLDAESIADLVRDQAAARDLDGSEDVRWWAESGCQRAHFKATDRARGGGATVCAGAGGADKRLSDRWSIGGGGSFTGGNLGIGGLGSGDYKAPRAFGYVGYQPRAFGLHGGGSVSKSSYNTTRPIVFQATLPIDLGGQPLTEGVDRTAESEQQGATSDTWSEIHDSRKIHEYTIEGTLGVRHVRISRSAFSETGAISLSLNGADEVISLTQTDVKIHGFRRSGRYRPFFDATYRRELAEGRTEADMNLSGFPASDFIVEGIGVPASTYSGRVGLTLDTFLGQATMVYEYKQAPGERRQSAGLRVRFK